MTDAPTQKPDWPAPIDPAEIPDQRARGWPDFHPETYCHNCGRTNPVWWIDSAMWDQTRGEDYVTILCPSCFTLAWEKQAGGRIIWELRPDRRTGRIRRGEVSLPAGLQLDSEELRALCDEAAAGGATSISLDLVLTALDLQ